MSDFLSTIIELLDHEQDGLSPSETRPTPKPAVPVADLPKATVPEVASQAPCPISPIPPGRLITYRGSDGTLCGGDLDRAHGTVAWSEYGSQGWTITLTDGQSVSLSAIRGVARTSADGQVVEAWTTRRHGYDGRAQ
jgi:hypothetical protein